MGVITNVQGIMIVNRSLDWISCTDCNVTSVGCACLFTAYSYMLVLISVIATYGMLHKKVCKMIVKVRDSFVSTFIAKY